MSVPEPQATLPAPNLVEVTYDDVALTVTAVWKPLPDYEEFAVVLFKDGGEFAKGEGFGATGAVKLTAPLPVGSGSSFEVAAAALENGQQGPFGNPMRVITGRLTALAATTEPPQIEAAWTLPQGSGLTNGAQLTLLGPSGLVTRASLLGSEGALTLPGPLASGAAYTLRARPLFGQSFGPYLELPLVTAPARIAQMTYEPGVKPQIKVLLAQPVPGVCVAGADLFADGVLVESAWGASGAVVEVPLPAALSPGVVWEVRPFWWQEEEEARGPRGPAVPVLVDSPTVGAVEVTGSKVTASWSTYPGPPYPSGAMVTVAPVGGGEAARTASFLGVSEGSFEPKPPLSPTTAYAVTVASLREPSFGPPGPSVPVFAAQPPAPSWARYDGTRLTAGWQATAPPGATGCSLVVLQGGSEIAHLDLPAAASGGTIEVPLGAVPGPYAVGLRWTAARSRGPLGPTAALVVAPPRLRGAVVAGEKVTLTFAGVSAPGVCGAVFSSPGEEEKRVANLGTSPATITIPTLAADPLVPLEVALVIQAGVAEGPRSEALPVLRSGVAPRLAGAEGGTLTVDWDAVPGGATAYLAILYEAGTAASTKSVKEPPARLDAGAAKPATSYTVGVVARAGGAAGPALTPVPVLLAAATLGKPSFDGSVLSATVTAPSGTGATLSGYELSLLRNGEAVQTVDREVPGDGVLHLAVDSPVDPRATYELAVRPRAGAALGPAVKAAAMLVAPALDSVSWESGMLTVDGSPGDLPRTGLTLYATLFQAGHDPQTKALTDGAAAFTAPTGSTYEVSMHGETAAAVGPPSSRLTALTAAPTIAAAEFAAGRVTAAWREVPAAAYAVAITDAGGATVAAATVDGLAAEFDLTTAAGAAYKLLVTPRDGRVSGPPATLPLVTAGCQVKATSAADGRKVKVEWSLAPGGPTPTGFIPTVRWEDTEFDLSPLPAGSTSAEVTLPAAVPAGAAIGVRAQAGAAIGPLANLAPVLAGTPEGLFLRYAAGTLRATWTPPVDARLTGAIVTLEANGTTTVTPVAGSSWSAAVAATGNATVAVTATGGAGAGHASGPVAALLTAPTIETCRYDGVLLQLTWSTTGLSAATDWRVVARHRDRVIAEATVATAAASLPVPLPAASFPAAAKGELTVTVTALNQAAEGPESAPTDVLVSAPLVTAAVTDALTGVTTVSWTEVKIQPAPTYAVRRYLDGAMVEMQETTATSFALPPLEPERDWEVAIAAITSSGSVDGPPGPRFHVPTGTPVVESVSFDGTTATVRWRGVAGASGYAIDVFGGSAPVSVGKTQAGAGAREAEVTLTTKARQAGRQVSVRALFGPSSGPRALAPLFSPGIYLGAGEPPRLQRAAAETIEAEPQVAYLPPMGLDTTKLPLGPVQPGTSPATKPFVLAANADAKSSAAFPYTLTIDHGALAFDATRTTLRETFIALLTEAADETRGAAKPWGLFAIQAAVARLMPQTFEETLLYAYGLDLEKGCVDLAPGMVLRVAFSEFDAIPAERSPSAATGYAGGAVVDYEVGDYFGGTEWLVGFDAFLAWLAGNSLIEVQAPLPGTAPPGPDFAESGGAEAADLFFPAFRTPFHRLFVPHDLLSPNAAASARTKEQFTLVAASKFADLQAAGTWPVVPKTSVAYFRGRAVLKPSLRITVDGEQRVVPIGTTVGNVLDGLGRRPPGTTAALRGVTLERSPGPVVTDPAQGYDVAAAEPVALDWEGLRTFGAPRGTLSLPLLHGDRLTVAG